MRCDDGGGGGGGRPNGTVNAIKHDERKEKESLRMKAPTWASGSPWVAAGLARGGALFDAVSGTDGWV